MLGYDTDDKYMYYMSHNQCACVNPLTTTMIHNQCMNPLTTAMIHNLVYESTNKLLWDFKIQINNKIEHDKPVLE